MSKIIKRISMFLVFGFLLTLTSSCEDMDWGAITPTIAQKVSGLSVALKGDDAVFDLDESLKCKWHSCDSY